MFHDKDLVSKKKRPVLSATFCFGWTVKRPVLPATLCFPPHPSSATVQGFIDEMGDGTTYYTNGGQPVYTSAPGYTYAPAGQPVVSYVQQAAPQYVQSRAVSVPAQTQYVQPAQTQYVQTRAVAPVANGPPVPPDDLPAGAT